MVISHLITMPGVKIPQRRSFPGRASKSSSFRKRSSKSLFLASWEGQVTKAGQSKTEMEHVLGLNGKIIEKLQNEMLMLLLAMFDCWNLYDIWRFVTAIRLVCIKVNCFIIVLEHCIQTHEN